MKKTFKHSKFTATFTDEGGYFSLTGEIDGSSGAVGDRIAKIDPEFAQLAKIHLSDCTTGAPMHAIENAKYFAKENKPETLQRHLRSSMAFAVELCEKAQFPNYDIEMVIAKSGIYEIWKEEARQAYSQADALDSNLVGAFVDPYDDNEEPISEEYADILDAFSEPEKAIAAAMQEDVDISEVEESGSYYTTAGREYVVYTDDEAEEAWDSELDNYLEELVLPELPENVRNYFDGERWKEDARIDGRGHSLGRYDGNECEEEVNGTTYYLYRQ